MESIELRPIGVIRTALTTREHSPRQGDAENGEQGSLELYAEYADGIRGLKPGMYLQLLFYFSRSEHKAITARPGGTGVETGVFATRSPDRPNGIGVTKVKLTSIDGSKLYFTGADMLDKSPLLDIKPYIGQI